MTEQTIAEVVGLAVPADIDMADAIAEVRARHEAQWREEEARFSRAVGAAMDVVGDLCHLDNNDGLGMDYSYLMEFVGSHIVAVTRERMDNGWDAPPAAPEAFRAFARYADFLLESREDGMARGLEAALDELVKAARHAATMYETVGHPLD
jgi:hypothetical protein